MKTMIFAALLLACGFPAQAQNSNPLTDSELAEINARGRALSEYDAAAWHGSDAVMALQPARSDVQRYIARKTDQGWVVAFGRFDESDTKFLVVYEAVQQSADLKQFKVMKHDPPLEDTDELFRAAKARVLVTADFLSEVKPQRPYNLSVLPASDGWYVYAIPGQTDAAVLPYGGDLRYLVSDDGTTILEKRQMHKSVLEEAVSANISMGFHTHVLSDLPEDSDVFYAMTRNAINGEWIATKKYTFQIHQGAVSYLDRTDEVLKGLKTGKYQNLSKEYASTVASSLQRLVSASSSANPLQAMTSLTGMRCENKTVWLKFSTVLHNIGEARIVLLNDALQNVQVRFAKTESDLADNKYEKLVFFSELKEDFSNHGSYTVLGPSMEYTKEREYPILGMDLSGKTTAQFMFFTWPVGQEQEAYQLGKSWEPIGFLYTDTLLSSPAPLKIDGEWLRDCVAK